MSLNAISNVANLQKERERWTQDARRKSIFDWPVAFTKVILIVANCTLAKCAEEHVNHKKQQSHVYPESLQYADEYTQT